MTTVLYWPCAGGEHSYFQYNVCPNRVYYVMKNGYHYFREWSEYKGTLCH